MAQKSDDMPAPAAAQDDLAPEAVAAYLQRNPDFLAENPQLLTALTPPELRRGESVIDMQTFMLSRLRAELDQIKGRETALLSAASSNNVAMGRIHGAVDQLLGARSFKHLIGVITEDLPALLKLEASALCVEAADKLPGKGSAAGVVVIEPGTIESLMRDAGDIALRADIQGDKAVFGASAGRIRSMALLRLSFGTKVPTGLLALGAAKAKTFDADQGTDMLAFLGRVVEHCIRRWLSQRR